MFCCASVPPITVDGWDVKGVRDACRRMAHNLIEGSLDPIKSLTNLKNQGV
jgi:hypothetical protein